MVSHCNAISSVLKQSSEHTFWSGKIANSVCTLSHCLTTDVNWSWCLTTKSPIIQQWWSIRQTHLLTCDMGHVGISTITSGAWKHNDFGFCAKSNNVPGIFSKQRHHINVHLAGNLEQWQHGSTWCITIKGLYNNKMQQTYPADTCISVNTYIRTIYIDR
jgi:hypothetical protein